MTNDITKLISSFTSVIDAVGGLFDGEGRDDLFESRDSAYKEVSDVRLGDQLVVGGVASVVTSLEYVAPGLTKLHFKDVVALTLPTDTKVRVA